AEALIGALADVEAGPVAFFVTTQFLSKGNGAERIEKYAAAGHFIANHTHSHPWANRTEVDAFLAEIDQAEEALAQFDNRRPWFRFPFLDEGRKQEKVDAIAADLDARGLVNGYVTVDNYDWHIEQRLQQAIRDGKSVDYEKLGRFYVGMLLYAAEYYDSLAVQELGFSPVHTLLLHENDLAALYADDLVRGFRQAGWDIVSPEEAYDHPLPAPESLRTGQGRIVGLASDAGRPASTMWTWAIDEAMVDLQLERSGAFGAPSDSLCTPPPSTPEILGPGEVSLKDRFEFGQTITANCKDLFVGIEHGVWQSVEHYRRTEKGWTHIRRIAGSESLSANDPYVTPDGERLYYIRHEGENTQIAYLDRNGVSSWNEPIILPPPVNTPAKEFYITFDVNGDLIFSSNRGRGDYNLYRAVLQGDKYVSVELLPENINSRGYEADPFIAPDGSYLLFASNRQGGKGRGDIYVSFKQSDGWSDPKPVEAINTAAHELCPFVSADGKALYFTSNEDLYVVDTSILDQYR
ncbi:MAG: polysaccharide deacetylase family protein, partial [Pseudomonadota bacterium]